MHHHKKFMISDFNEYQVLVYSINTKSWCIQSMPSLGVFNEYQVLVFSKNAKTWCIQSVPSLDVFNSAFDGSCMCSFRK